MLAFMLDDLAPFSTGVIQFSASRRLFGCILINLSVVLMSLLSVNGADKNSSDLSLLSELRHQLHGKQQIVQHSPIMLKCISSVTISRLQMAP